MKKCLHCAEEIQDEAVICRFCQRSVAPLPVPAPALDSPDRDVESAEAYQRHPVGARVGCPYCAKTVAVGDSACKHCGASLPGASPEAVDSPAATIIARRKTSKGCLVALVVVLGALGLLVVMVALLPDSGRPSAARPEREPQETGFAGSANEQRPPSGASVPQYRVASRKDVSFGIVRRLQVKVALPTHYQRNEVESIARLIVADLTKAQEVNAVSMLFYGPGTSTAGICDVAMIEWAPNGRWADAATVKAGTYGSFKYSVSYNQPPAPPQEQTGRLKKSSTAGLLGAPLPEGAVLLSRTPGDAATMRDPTENYSIRASAGEIAAFFVDAMPQEGWAKDGSSREYVLMYRKGSLMIGVLIDSDGGTFTLMGS